jgi:cereblon
MIAEIARLRGDSSRPASGRESTSPTSDASERRRIARWLECRTCRNPIADPGAVFAGPDGCVRRLFANPHGRVFEILTVVDARGLLLFGSAETEFTWFTGYAWRVAYCERCAMHLGWRFEAGGPELRPACFFALVTSELVEGDAA